MIFGMMYWLLPRMYQAKLHSQKLANAHFWFNTLGIVLYILPIYVAGITQGLMWRWIDDSGQLAYPDFVETTHILVPLYWVRVLGGLVYLSGAILGVYNLIKTWQARPATYAPTVSDAPRLVADYVDPPRPDSRLRAAQRAGFRAQAGQVWLQGWWHRKWERLPLTFTVWAAVAVVSASLFEIIPTFLKTSERPDDRYGQAVLAAGVGRARHLHVGEGCYNCHSQQIRPILAETKRYGEYSKPGEFIYDRPFQWGSRRIGPDLSREGISNPNAVWHIRHFENPRQIREGSIMPSYAFLLSSKLDFEGIPQRMQVMYNLGVPYSEEEIAQGAELARAQARKIAEDLVSQGEREGLEDTQAIALVAYLQRLGTDLFATAEEPADAADGVQTAETEPAESEPAETSAGPQVVSR
jgi:cytochrome c oxidase cbb3-type subunit I/II